MPGYLDNAATSHPKPEAVYQAVNDALRAGASPNRGIHETGMQATRRLYQVREKVARFLGIRDAARLAFTHNATDSLNIALKGFLRPGDHVVTTAMEHNSVTRPLRSLMREGVRATTVKPDASGRISTRAFLEAVHPGTRLAICTHASNVFGGVNPVEEIARSLNRRGIPLLVDAAQTAGYSDIDIDSSGVAIWCAPGHKSLLGPPGTGLLYVREDLSLRPFREGGTGAGSRLDMPVEWPEAFEAGTHNLPALAGLAAAIGFLEEQGLSKVRDHKHRLIGNLREALLRLDGVRIFGRAAASDEAPLLTFNLDGVSSDDLAARLAGEGYDVRGGFHCAPSAHEIAGTGSLGAVRVSPGVFNDDNDITGFVASLKKTIRKDLS